MGRSCRATISLLCVSLFFDLAILLAWPASAASASGRPKTEQSVAASRPGTGHRVARAAKRSRPALRRRGQRQDAALTAMLTRPHAGNPGLAISAPGLTVHERQTLEGSFQEETATPAPSVALPRPPATPFIWPVVGPVNSPFGPRRARFHTAIDIGARHADPVAAAADGRVLYARASRGALGNVVVLEHGDGLRTVYAHLSRLAAREGTTVRQGERIGTVGRTGRATGFHLHFEVRHQGTPVPPQTFLPRTPGESVGDLAAVAPSPLPDPPGAPDSTPVDDSAWLTPADEPAS